MNQLQSDIIKKLLSIRAQYSRHNSGLHSCLLFQFETDRDLINKVSNC